MDVTFGGVLISELFGVRDIRRSILPPRENRTISVPSKHGHYFAGYSYLPRYIEVDFVILSDDMNATMRTLAWMLDISNPSPLIFGDEPTKIFYGILDGETPIEAILHVGYGTLRFLCVDPFAYSNIEKTYEADLNGRMIINNGGTAPTEPVFDIFFPANASYVALVSPQGVVQVGNSKQIDENPQPNSELLIDDSMSSTATWVTNTNGKTFTPNTVIQGTVMTNNFNIRPDSWGTDQAGWFGPTIRRDIGITSDGTGVANNWEASAKFKFRSDDWFGTQPQQKQVGKFEFLIMDSTNAIIAGFTMRDSYEGYQFNVPEFHVGGSTIFTDNPQLPSPQTITQYNSTTNTNETKTITQTDVGVWNDFWGQIIIRKTGNQIYFELQRLEPIDPNFDEPTDPHRVTRKISKTWYDTAGTYSAKNAKTINIWFGKYKTSPSMGLNYVDHVRFIKHNVADYNDVPNIFHVGDKVTIDCRRNAVYKNDVLYLDRIDIGSTFFSIVEGETEIQMLHSSEGGQPTCHARIVEKYL